MTPAPATRSFDRSLLPEARFEFVVIADTHYMLDPGERPLEFESRRKQSARVATALGQVAALEPAFVVHLGDLVQEYPETPDFVRAQDEAVQQLRDCGLEVRRVAGNQDVGDKPDPTMPARPVTPASLEAYHRRFGPSWYSFDHQDLHCVVLNSQIMNAAMPEAAAQRQWLEDDLETHAGARICAFWHLPPYLGEAGEPHLGNYDNLGEPARTWLLGRLRAFAVELLFCGHVHFAFCDNLGPTRYRVTPSTSFTRPGFSHLFAGGPPPEQGRDDAAKLGFYLCRVFADRIDLHFIRTRGALAPESGPARLLTPLPPNSADTAAGLTLVHPLSLRTEVPLAWPSVVRQPVRNDYPLLSCLELGLSRVRVPFADLEDSQQRPRLELLHREGVGIQAFFLWSAAMPLEDMQERHGALVEAWEVQVPGALCPPPAWAERLQNGPRPLSLAPVVTARAAGKQHPRTRIGYRPAELPALDQGLQQSGLDCAAALCRIDRDASPWDATLALRGLGPPNRIERIDLLFELPGRDDNANALQTAEALFAALLLPSARLYVEPLVDLDRTMDARHGLLDNLCNPRPSFEVLRCLNAALQPFRGAWFEPHALEAPGLRILRLQSGEVGLALVLPEGKKFLPAGLFEEVKKAANIRLYHLARGRVEQPEINQLEEGGISGPALLVMPDCGNGPVFTITPKPPSNALPRTARTAASPQA